MVFVLFNPCVIALIAHSHLVPDGAGLKGGIQKQVTGVFLVLNGRKGIQRLGVFPRRADGRAGIGVFFGEPLGSECAAQAERVVQTPLGTHAALVGFVVRESPLLAVQFVVVQLGGAWAQALIGKVPIAGHTSVLGLLVRGIELDLQVVADVPVHGEADEFAAAFLHVDGGFAILGQQVQAIGKLALVVDFAAEVTVQVIVVAARIAQGHAAVVLVSGALKHVVDQAAG